ncbi:hypothetical protein FJT64_022232 [Amphibalanus amphitrite]|uniref:Uncharacterized protein n=2 Tax=Amphibalanus amphitrite TaxID=1232801 RepID=A0A6A4WHM8_AMPAM|nr:hypothetical protein FJT64_022232 [Amphibalanus amphitrite]
MAPVRPIQARRSSLRQDSEEIPERFSSLPEHFQDPEDVPQPQAMLALVAPPVPLPQRPAQVPLVTSQLPQYGPYEVPRQYQQLPTAGFYPYALQTPSAQQPALSTGDPAAQTVLPSGRTPSRSSEFISPVRFTTQLRRSEAQRAALLTELRNADLWRQSGDQTRGSHGINTPPAAPGRSPTTANTSSASGRPRHPPEPIKRGDLSKVSSGLVLTATEGLTLPLSAAAAILDKFGSAMAVPFPGMGAAIARAAGVLGGAAQSATRLAPTMAPLLVDTLEEVWKQAARAESQSATATGRWEDFNNGINVFEVTAHGDGVPVRTGENEQDTQRGESVQDETKERVSVNTSRRGPGDEVKVVNERTESVAVEQTTPTPESRRENAKDEKKQEDDAKEQEDEELADPSDATLLVEVEDDDPDTAVWQNMDWAQFLLNRRQVQAAQGISARSLDLTE